MMLHFDRNLEAARRDIEKLQAKRRRLEARSRIFSALRQWFSNAGFLELETPVRLPCPALEDYIDAIPAGREQWLRTSPELHLKRLLAAGYERLFEIGPCFRLGESGDHHREEFTMLEWYRSGGSWEDLMDDARNLVHAAVKAVASSVNVPLPFRGRMVAYDGEWPRITVADAFRKFADTDVKQAIREGNFEKILCTEVEPHLGMEKPTFLTEYPLECSGLAAQLPGKPGCVARWELYVCGLEIGNACSELVDAAEQERRFEATACLRASEKRPVYPMDQPFMNAIWNGMKCAAGTAIGLDRLVMALTDAGDIDEVKAF